jgi:hypothetical protein
MRYRLNIDFRHRPAPGADIAAHPGSNAYTVHLSAAEIRAFAAAWPCSHLPSRALWLQFDATDDLIDIAPGFENANVYALNALLDDARAFAAAQRRRLAQRRRS